MATVTGTLLLRPVASKGTVASSVPADTSIEDIYKLVNEEVADDDSTKFTPTYMNDSQAPSTDTMLCLKYDLPEEIEITSLANIRHIIRKSSTGGMWVRPICYSSLEFIASDDAGHNVWWPEDDGWITITDDNTTVKYQKTTDLSASDGSFDGCWDRIVELLNTGDFGLAYSTSATKNVPAVSQAYIELDCTYKEAGTPLYFKQNGEWAELLGNIYQKADGEWLEADVSVLSGEFPVEEVAI